MVNKVCLGNHEYPNQLAIIKDPPKVLYYKGEWRSEIFNNCLAIIGTRNSTPYGEKVVKTLIEGLDDRITIVSSFMTGIDRAAHTCAIKRNLVTVGVLPCGIDIVFPAENRDIYNSILDTSGLILSEYPKDTPPRKWTFLQRNRIVAGLSKVILVVEASEGSGSLHTASLARDFGRILGAIPGSIFSRFSEGPYKILREGGVLISDSRQINSLFNFEHVFYSSYGRKAQKPTGYGFVLEALRSGDLSAEELNTVTGIKTSILNTLLVQLEISGQIIERNGRFYAG